MDFLQQLGPLALASRMRRLAERLHRDGERVYAAHGVPFEPRWFQIVARLLAAGDRPLSITELAADLGVAHPGVVRTARELEDEGLVAAHTDENDRRRRLLSLTRAGHDLVAELEPVWRSFEEAAGRLFADADCDLIADMDRIERALDETDMAQRVLSCAAGSHAEPRIVPHRPDLARHFRALNLQWLRGDFRVEPYDERQLSRPQETVIDPGGEILYAQVDGRTVGTVALLRLSPRRFELAKMAVDRAHRGRGIGGRLLAAAIDHVRRQGADRIVLTTHPAHAAAVALYRRFGFVETTVESPGGTAVERAANGFGMALDLRSTPQEPDEGAPS